MKLIASAALLATIGASCRGRGVANIKDEAERRAIVQLTSRDVSESRVAFAVLQRKPHLSPETVEVLIGELGRPKDGHLLANDTLITVPIPATEILARHPESGEPLRRALRTNPSPQVRRFAALASGEMRYEAAIPDLRSAMRDAMAPPDAEELHRTELDPRAILDASVNAYARIDSGGATEYLVSFVGSDRVAARERAYEAMSLLHSGVVPCTHDQVISGECGRMSRDWWATARHRYDRREAAPSSR
jgi:hypothetical protein